MASESSVPHTVTRIGRVRGALVGAAVGDALGTTLEFEPPPPPAPVAPVVPAEGVGAAAAASASAAAAPPRALHTEMLGGGPFRLLPGQWTDDTSTLLCLGVSLLLDGGFEARAQLRRYAAWYREGLMSSTGECFDVGITTRMALERAAQDPALEFPGEALAREQGAAAARAGNGSLMRLAPCPIFFAHTPRAAVEAAGRSSATTHGAAQCVDACEYFAMLLLGCLEGRSKEELLAPFFTVGALENYWERRARPLCEPVAEIARGTYKAKVPPEICGKGYVVSTLEAVLWAFHSTDTFRDALVKVVNLRDDADTTGAILGALAGCFYGLEAIPCEWGDRISLRPLIVACADELAAFSVDAARRGAGSEFRAVFDFFERLDRFYAGTVVRRKLPGPRAYTSLRAFEDDARELARLATPLDAPWQRELLADFERRLEADRKTLARRLGQDAAMGALLGQIRKK